MRNSLNPPSPQHLRRSRKAFVAFYAPILTAATLVLTGCGSAERREGANRDTRDTRDTQDTRDTREMEADTVIPSPEDRASPQDTIRPDAPTLPGDTVIPDTVENGMDTLNIRFQKR